MILIYVVCKCWVYLGLAGQGLSSPMNECIYWWSASNEYPQYVFVEIQGKIPTLLGWKKKSSDRGICRYCPTPTSNTMTTSWLMWDMFRIGFWNSALEFEVVYAVFMGMPSVCRNWPGAVLKISYTVNLYSLEGWWLIYHVWFKLVFLSP